MSSVVFKNNVLTEFPDWYATTYNNDDTLFIMLSKYGKAKFINEYCTVYRVNSEGVSSSNFSFERDIKGRIKYYIELKSYLDHKFNKPINHLVAQYYLKLIKLFIAKKENFHAFKFLSFVFYFDFSVILIKLKNKIVFK